jgi:hypothetical protein
MEHFIQEVVAVAEAEEVVGEHLRAHPPTISSKY